MKNNIKVYSIIAAIAYVVMVTVNALANILPINGMTTGEISDSFPNLFTPIGLTFSIWGLIYVLLGLFTLYILGVFNHKESKLTQENLQKVIILYIITSVLNSVWILTWHYLIIWLSVLVMLVLLISLIRINQILFHSKLNNKEKLLVRLPFSIYFGWITVATIANITALLVDLNWNGFGISEEVWTVIILLVGMLIASLTVLRFRDIAYGAVVLWAYLGILLKHLSPTGFDSAYPLIITTIGISMGIILLSIVEVLWRKKVARK